MSISFPGNKRTTQIPLQHAIGQPIFRIYRFLARGNVFWKKRHLEGDRAIFLSNWTTPPINLTGPLFDRERLLV